MVRVSRSAEQVMTDFVCDRAAKDNSEPIVGQLGTVEQQPPTTGLDKHAFGAWNRGDCQGASSRLWNELANRPAFSFAVERCAPRDDEHTQRS